MTDDGWRSYSYNYLEVEWSGVEVLELFKLLEVEEVSGR